MKPCHCAILLLALALASCQKPTATSADEPPFHDTIRLPVASTALEAIDSLAERAPDSAWTLLTEWFAVGNTAPQFVAVDSITADSIWTDTLLDRHYAALLLAEAFYRGDYAQTNRDAVMGAAAYLDSLVRQLPPSETGKREAASSRNADFAFLAARAHYINGVGHFENDSVALACEEYINALETMTAHFPETALTGRKARFMALCYNRLNELFTSQFMMHPAIVCGKEALAFLQNDPINAYSVSKTLHRIGIMYDNLGEKDSADYYYSRAITSLPDTFNLFYRDLSASQVLLAYQTQGKPSLVVNRLKQLAADAADEEEMLTRHLTIGYVYYSEQEYDSALVYLASVFERETDIESRIQAAEYLRVIYDSLGQSGKDNLLIRFLADNKSVGFDSKATVSHVSELFQGYLSRKQERERRSVKAEPEKNTVKGMIAVGTVFVLCLAVIFRIRIRKRLGEMETKTLKSMEEKEKFHKEELEKKDLAHKEERELLQERLKQREAQLDAMEKEKSQKRASLDSRKNDFLEEPICLKITSLVGDLHLTARSRYGDYHHVRLGEDDSVALGEAVSRHFPHFKSELARLSSKMDRKDFQMCYLYLLGLEDVQIAVLQQCHNSTIYRRREKMQSDFAIDQPLVSFVRKLAYEQE